jgi:ferredoxin
MTFIVEIGYERSLAVGIVDALKESGLSGEALLATARQLAGRWEVGEDEGMETLAACVQMNMSKTKGKKILTVYIVPPNSWNSEEGQENETDDYDAMLARAFPVSALEGTSLTDAAKFGTGEGASTLGEYIECACAGIMACSTCHVVVADQWFDKVGEAGEDEQDMLDWAYSPRDTSRLACQIILEKKLDGLVIKIPKGAYNLMDYIPFGE